MPARAPRYPPHTTTPAACKHRPTMPMRVSLPRAQHRWLCPRVASRPQLAPPIQRAAMWTATPRDEFRDQVVDFVCACVPFEFRVLSSSRRHAPFPPVNQGARAPRAHILAVRSTMHISTAPRSGRVFPRRRTVAPRHHCAHRTLLETHHIWRDGRPFRLYAYPGGQPETHLQIRHSTRSPSCVPGPTPPSWRRRWVRPRAAQWSMFTHMLPVDARAKTSVMRQSTSSTPPSIFLPSFLSSCYPILTSGRTSRDPPRPHIVPLRPRAFSWAARTANSAVAPPHARGRCLSSRALRYDRHSTRRVP